MGLDLTTSPLSHYYGKRKHYLSCSSLVSLSDFFFNINYQIVSQKLICYLALQAFSDLNKKDNWDYCISCSLKTLPHSKFESKSLNARFHWFFWQVAERALFLWNNDHIRNLITQNCKVILPIIFPALERNTRGHWNQAVQSLTLNVRKIFSDADQTLFDECLVKFKEDEVKERETQEKRESTWKRLEDVAASKAVSNEAVLVSRFVSSVAIATSTKPLATGSN